MQTEFFMMERKAFELQNNDMQDLHSILLSLQKEKLVDIISTLSESNINFKNQLLLLISEKKSEN